MVMRFIRTGTRVFTSEQHTILSAATVIGFIFCISAFLGFIKNRLLSGFFGDSAELGVYFAADAIPNLIFSLLVSGALSAAFIPVFTRYHKKNPSEAWDVTSSVLNVSLVIFLIFTTIVILSADFIAREIIARNSDLSAADLKLLADLMRIMMVAQIILIFSSFFTSILQSFNKFVVPALAPVAYNVGIIIFILIFVKPLGIYAPAYGMVFGAFLHMFTQIPLIRATGYKFSFFVDIREKGVREVYKLMVPRTIGQAAQKFLGPLYTNLALFISAPSNVILTFATDIQSLPVKVFGVSIGQAALPILANAIREDGDLEEFKSLLLKTLQQIVFFVLPLSILIFVLRVPLVRLAVGASKYSWEATVMTSYSLGFFSISLVAQSVIMILARAFYALRDTKTPLFISTIAILINAILAVWFVRHLNLGVWSLALAYTIGSYINFALLFFFLLKKIGGTELKDFLFHINRIGIASFITGVALYLPFRAMDELVFDTTRTPGLIVLTATVSVIGFVTYVFFAWLLKIRDLELIVYTFGVIKKKLIRDTGS